MEITSEQIIEAIKKNPAHVAAILPTIQEDSAFKTLLENKTTAMVNEQIGNKVNEIHSKYDEDIFQALGVRAGSKDNGKQKTYELAKELFTELADLRKTKDSLTKDAKVIELQGMIDKLKTEGGAKHVQEVFDQAKAGWDAEKVRLETERDEAKNSAIDFQKLTEIKNAQNQIKFAPDTSDAIKKMVLDNVEKDLLASSKIENGKLVFVDKDGKPLVNEKHETKSALEMLNSSEALKAITLKETQGGGGAPPTIEGSIIKVNVNGKDEEKLSLQSGGFKSKIEFQKHAEKTLADQGISISDDRYQTLYDEAYKEHKVADLPAEA